MCFLNKLMMMICSECASTMNCHEEHGVNPEEHEDGLFIQRRDGQAKQD